MKKSAVEIGRGWTMTKIVIVIMILLFIASGCAEIKLGTLPTPPPKARLRVYVQAISVESDRLSFQGSHEDFEVSTYGTARAYLSQMGAYEIVPIEDVRLITGNAEIPGRQWSEDDWALAVEVGRRLYADYILIAERELGSMRYIKSLLINVESNKKFQVLSTMSSAAGYNSWRQQYQIDFAELFRDANEDILSTANRKTRAVSSELAAARKDIQELTKAPEKKTEADRPLKEKEAVTRERPLAIDADKDAKVAALEAKLAKLMETLIQLEEMKKQIEEQKQKSDTLVRELVEKDQREKELLTQLEESLKAAPVIVLAFPREDSTVDVNFVQFSGVVEDEKGLTRLEIFINDKPLTKGSDRGLRVAPVTSTKRLEFTEHVSLVKGANRLKVRAVDSDGLATEKTVTVQYVERLKNIWAVVIGIDKYPNIRQLKYAVNDAGLFYDHLVKRNQIPAENVMLLLNQDATLTKIRSVLGTDLKNKAGKDDMVVIYFAGHGATERDAQSPDGDGLEKYLLPFEADLKDLYATALPMEELTRIFNRIRSERLIFIADACYSGASGGRTIGVGGMRASISEGFIDRIAGGKGRVIMTASGANEVSAEKDELGHGVFTYYLIEGLKGKADTDRDGVVTVDEAFNYVSKLVPAATDQEQHPVKKGTVEGRLILSITQ